MNTNQKSKISDSEWKVTFNGGFWKNKGRPCKEISVNREFLFRGKRRFIPSVYVCTKGILLDICTQVDPKEISAFMDKWDLFHEEDHFYGKEQQRQIEKENPLNFDFEAHAFVNGKEVRSDHGCGVSYFPPCCLPEGIETELEAKAALSHYGFDPSFGYTFKRCAFLWTTKQKPKKLSLTLHLSACPEEISGPHLKTPSEKHMVFQHPITGESHTLTVHSCTAEKLGPQHFFNKAMEYPPHYTLLTYTLSPEISDCGFRLFDCADSDSPQCKEAAPHEFAPTASCSVGIIGGADGPTALLLSPDDSEKMHAACSSLHFEPQGSTEWAISFSVKKAEDVDLIILK